MDKIKSLLGASLLSLCFMCSSALAAPQAGWWWNPAESGRGFFIESQNGITYLAGYFYADDGRARWLVAGGSNDDPYHYQGRLLEYSGGQTLFGAYVPPKAPADAGAIAVDFADDTHATISWPGGVIQIEREIFGTGAAAFQPESGWWWNPDESGSGYSVELQGNNLFVVGFMYDGAGNPVWYYSAGPTASPTTYSGALLQFANGQTLTGPYHPPSAPTTAGTLAVQFTAADTGTLTFSDAGANALDAKAGHVPRIVPIRREFVMMPSTPLPPYELPSSYTGKFTQTDTESYLDMVGGTITITTTITGNLTWTPVDDCLLLSGVCRAYDASGTLHVHVDYSDYEPKGEFSCVAKQDGSTDNDFQVSSGTGSTLEVDADRNYRMRIGIPNATLSPLTYYYVNLQCEVAGMEVPNGGYKSLPEVDLPVKTTWSGVIQANAVKGSMPSTGVSGILKRTGSWVFFGNL